ncbi:MAG: hypothetical protein ACSW8A_09230 [Lachnospiraceae bacterium]
MRIKQTETLKSRITDFYTMEGLKPGEVPEYVLHKLKLAGARENMMDEEALNSLYDYSSNGNYRFVNKLVHDAIYLGAQTERMVIDRNIIVSAASCQF